MLSSNAAITVAFFAATASVAWSAAYAWAKWLPHRHDAPPAEPLSRANVDGERIARLEGAVEALAVEIERVAEGQRYTARLLEERLPLKIEPPHQARAGEGRVITPH